MKLKEEIFVLYLWFLLCVWKIQNEREIFKWLKWISIDKKNAVVVVEWRKKNKLWWLLYNRQTNKVKKMREKLVFLFCNSDLKKIFFSEKIFKEKMKFFNKNNRMKITDIRISIFFCSFIYNVSLKVILV